MPITDVIPISQIWLIPLVESRQYKTERKKNPGYNLYPGGLPKTTQINK
jgi:hypothetical protein